MITGGGPLGTERLLQDDVKQTSALARFGLATALCARCAGRGSPRVGAPRGIVAAYSFDEGSGSVAVDASGNGHAGAIVGATLDDRRPLRRRPRFDGSNDYVGLGSLGTFYQGGFTLQAWVQKATSEERRRPSSARGREAARCSGSTTSRPATTSRSTAASRATSTRLSNPVLATWQHLAATYDGATARFYIDGRRGRQSRGRGGVGNSNIWRIGAYGGSPGGFFDGLIDDVRIYDRALSATEIARDRDQPVGIVDPGMPTEPANFTVTATTKTSLAVLVRVDRRRRRRRLPSTSNGAEATTTSGTTHHVRRAVLFHELRARGRGDRRAGNVSPRASVSGSTSLCQGPLGLVAAYSFDEGSGTTAVDESGNDRTGAIVGASWTAAATAARSASTAATITSSSAASAASRRPPSRSRPGYGRRRPRRTSPSSAAGPAAVRCSGSTTSPATTTSRSPAASATTSTPARFRRPPSGSTSQPPTTAPLPATTSTASRCASRTVDNGPGVSDTWRIGAYGGSPGGFFDGVIDDVRIYNRALSATEIQSTAPGPPVPP